MLIDDGKQYHPLTRAEACLKLSKLVRTTIGINFAEDQIDKLFREHWTKLSILAHQIHAAEPK